MKLSNENIIEMYTKMIRIRKFESRAMNLLQKASSVGSFTFISVKKPWQQGSVRL